MLECVIFKSSKDTTNECLNNFLAQKYPNYLYNGYICKEKNQIFKFIKIFVKH